MFTLQPTPPAISTVPWSAGALIDRLPTLDNINHKGKVHLEAQEPMECAPLIYKSMQDITVIRILDKALRYITL